MQNTLLGKIIEAALSGRLSIPSLADGGIMARGPTLDISSVRSGMGMGMQGVSLKQDFSFSIEISTTRSIDEEFVRNELFPALKTELRRESIDGKRLIEATGIGL
jgi:hypothetical protein